MRSGASLCGKVAGIFSEILADSPVRSTYSTLNRGIPHPLREVEGKDAGGHPGVSTAATLWARRTRGGRRVRLRAGDTGSSGGLLVVAPVVAVHGAAIPASNACRWTPGPRPWATMASGGDGIAEIGSVGSRDSPVARSVQFPWWRPEHDRAAGGALATADPARGRDDPGRRAHSRGPTGGARSYGLRTGGRPSGHHRPERFLPGPDDPAAQRRRHPSRGHQRPRRDDDPALARTARAGEVRRWPAFDDRARRHLAAHVDREPSGRHAVVPLAPARPDRPAGLPRSGGDAAHR